MNYPKIQIPTSPFKLKSEWSNKAWATMCISLGAWETLAVTTRKIPTISDTCWSARRRHARQTEAAIVIWLAGLGAHLLKQHSDA